MQHNATLLAHHVARVPFAMCCDLLALIGSNLKLAQFFMQHLWRLQVKIWKLIYLNCGEWYEDMIDHRSYAHNLAIVKLKPEKNSGLNGIRTHDLSDTGAGLYQLSYQVKWELATLWVRNIPVEGKGNFHIFTSIRYLLWHTDLHVHKRKRWLTFCLDWNKMAND